MTPQFVGLDFDGVLCDSINECYVTAGRAYRKMLEETESASSFEASPEFASFFREYRHFVRPAGEYFLLFQSYFQHPELKLTEQVFQKLVQKYHNEINKFEEMFFAARELARQESLDRWLELHTFYAGVTEFLAEPKLQQKIVIITMKDQHSVDLLLRKMGQRNIAVYGNEYIKRFGSKENIISSLLQEYCLAPQHFHYLDDNLQHLREIKPTRVNCYFAAWGYSSVARQEVMAEQVNYCENMKQFSRALL